MTKRQGTRARGPYMLESAFPASPRIERHVDAPRTAARDGTSRATPRAEEERKLSGAHKREESTDE